MRVDSEVLEAPRARATPPISTPGNAIWRQAMSFVAR